MASWDTSSKEDANKGKREMFHGRTFQRYSLKSGTASLIKRRSTTKKVTRLEWSRGMNSWAFWIKYKTIRKFQLLILGFSKRDMPPFPNNLKTKNLRRLRNGSLLNGKKSMKNKDRNFKQNMIAKKLISTLSKTLN